MKKSAVLFVILGSALWGTDALFRRPLTGVLSPLTIVLLEHCLLSLVLLPAAARYRDDYRRLRRRDYAALLFIALGGSVAATSLFTHAMKYGNPSVVLLLQKMRPLFTVLLARIFLGERPARRFWPWFVTAVAGACLLAAPGRHLAPAPGNPAAVLCALGAAALWGSATVCGRYIVPRMPTLLLTAGRVLLALPALVVLYLLQPAAHRQLPVALSPVLNIVGLALLPGLAGLLLYYRGLRSTTASLASVCELSFPVTAVALNWLVLGVRLSGFQFLGTALLVLAVTLLALFEPRERNAAQFEDAKPLPAEAGRLHTATESRLKTTDGTIQERQRRTGDL